MIGHFKLVLGHNFFMGMQNVQWSFKSMIRFLIHALELKLQPFEVFLYVCTGKPYVCSVFRPRAKWGVRSRAHMNVTTITRFVQIICSMHASRATSYTVLLSGRFSLCQPRGLKKKVFVAGKPCIINCYNRVHCLYLPACKHPTV